MGISTNHNPKLFVYQGLVLVNLKINLFSSVGGKDA